MAEELKILQVTAVRGLYYFLKGAERNPRLVLEVFEECHDDLVTVMETDGLRSATLQDALRCVSYLVGGYSDSDTSPVDAVVVSAAFGAGILASIARCYRRSEMRQTLYPTMGLFVHVLNIDKGAKGLAGALDSDGFRRVVLILQRELLRLSTKPEPPPEEALNVVSADSKAGGGREVCPDLIMAVHVSRLLAAIHDCPYAWAAAGAGRRNNSAYPLLALLLRQPYRNALALGVVAMTADVEVAEGGVAAWTRLVKDSYDSGCVAALLCIFQRPMSEQHHLWYLGASLLRAFVDGFGNVQRSSGIPVAAYEIYHPGADRELVETLASNVAQLSAHIQAELKNISYADVEIHGNLLVCLMIICQGPDEESIHSLVSGTGVVRPVLRALATLNSIAPELIIRPCRKVAQEQPTLELFMVNYRSAHSFLFKMAFVLSDVVANFSSDGSAAIVGGTCLASTVVSGRQSVKTEHARAALDYGLATLTDLIISDCHDGGLMALSVLAAKHKLQGNDIVALAGTIVKNAQWSKATTAPEVLQTEQKAIRFLGSTFFSPDPLTPMSPIGAIGLACASDEWLMKGYLRAMDLDDLIDDQIVEYVYISFTNMTTCFLMMNQRVPDDSLVEQQANILEVWLRAGVFSLLPTAATKPTNSSEALQSVAIRAVFGLAMMGMSVKSRGTRISCDRYIELGKFVLFELFDAGVEDLLENRDRSVVLHDCLEDIDGALSRVMDCFYYIRAFANSPDGIRRQDPEVVIDLSGQHVEVENLVTADGEPFTQYRIGAPSSRRVNRQARICSSPECSAVRSPDVRLKKCACSATSYCSRVCQKNDWPAHKLTCTHRIRRPVVIRDVD